MFVPADTRCTNYHSNISRLNELVAGCVHTFVIHGACSHTLIHLGWLRA
jgi:hypothetical protein